MFDTLDEGQYTDHRQELLTLLQASRPGQQMTGQAVRMHRQAEHARLGMRLLLVPQYCTFPALSGGRPLQHACAACCWTLLQGSVWQQLQISGDVHSAVFAWVHYRQVGCDQGPPVQLVGRQPRHACWG